MTNKARSSENVEKPLTLPLLPLRDIVMFPGAVSALLVGRERSIQALSQAWAAEDSLLLVVAQRESAVGEPGPEDLYRVGTLARVHQRLRLPDGTTKILLEGLGRARVLDFVDEGSHFCVQFEQLNTEEYRPDAELVALSRRIEENFRAYAELSSRVPDDVVLNVAGMEDIEGQTDAIAQQLFLRASTKQRLLEETSLLERMRSLAGLLRRENEILEVEARIEGEVAEQVEQGEKEIYLNQQLRAIRKELGADDDDELEELIARIETLGMSEEAREAAMKEVGRLAKMPMMSPEAAVIRSYLDVLLELPWDTRSSDRLDTRRARRQLDADHYGLDKVKERIVEYLSVVKVSGRLQGTILCLVGPPGVGKTSLGRSIAEAMGRKFVRVALGGVRDEAEIRGHRRTYIGSRAGRILDGMRRAGTCNPVFLLDEIDKLGSDFRGDPSSALLEVLDPEQNRQYSDHFLEVPFDLSEVFFITTANVVEAIPPALEDRMEILRIPGYLDQEKLAIARRFLLPRLRKSHGLERTRFTVSDTALNTIIQQHTREAGVRNLERELASICRKVARRKAERRKVPRIIGATNLEKFLGPAKFVRRVVDEEPEIGVVTGLAWTPVGGEILEIEVALLPGTGKLLLTGNLRDVMKESAKAALSWTRARYPAAADRLAKTDIHVHVPEGAVPKDGPSAGIAMATALASAVTGRRVRRDVAMTGEITLRGRVLPIGGLPEKSVAAIRAGCSAIVLPRENEKNHSELPKDVRRRLRWSFVDHVDEVLDIALVEADDRVPAASSDDRPRPAAH